MGSNNNRREKQEQSSSDRSISRRPLLGSIGAFGLAAGLAGRVGANENEDGEGYDSWPDVDDEYYAGLVEELSQLDIAPGQFVYAESEAETFAAYELAGASEDLGDRESVDVSDEDVPFSAATRIEVDELEDESIDPWDVTFQADVEDRPVSPGDALLGVAYLRTPQTGGSTADVTYKSTDSDNEADNHVLNGDVTIDQEWQRYFFPIDFETTGEDGDWWTEFWVGVENQTVEIGGLALLDFARGVDPDDLPSWTEEADGLEPEEGWEEDADTRIHEHRMADLTVDVRDADGDPIAGTDVAVEMREHEFTFGTAVDAPRLIEDDSEDADQYRELIPELFNTAVLENYHKWQFFESDQELADEATEWLLDAGLDMRGHAALWDNVGAHAVPPDVVSAMGIEWEDGDVTDPELDPAHVEERSFDHVETIIDHYGDDMLHWDVVNEAIHEPEMMEVIDGEDVDHVEAPVLAEWYETATEVAPEGVALDVNDYNTLVGPYPGTRDEYERQIEFLADAEGVDLGGIGMQSHFSRGTRLTPEEILAAFDRYTEAGDGAPLRITEFDMADPNWLEEEKAEFFHWFLKTVFSHPDAEDFLMWGFWDDEHWQDDAPLFYDDWSEKPTYDVYTDLVFDEWWTDADGETDADGSFDVDAFLGEHELTVSFDEANLQTTLSITDPDGESIDVVLVDIDVRGSGRGNGRMPVHLHGGDAFDPSDVDYDTVRFGDPDLVAAGDGSEVVHLPGGGGGGGSSNGNGRGRGNGRGNGRGRGNRSQMIHFDGEDVDLDGVAMLFGRTEDGDLLVGFDRV